MSNQQASYQAGRGFQSLGPFIGQMTMNDVIAAQSSTRGFNRWWRQSGSSGELLRGVTHDYDWRTYTPRPIREGHGPLRRSGKKDEDGDAPEAPAATGRPSAPQGTGPTGPGTPGPFTAQSASSRSHFLGNVRTRTMNADDVFGGVLGPSGQGALPPGSQFDGGAYPALGMGNWKSNAIEASAYD